MIRILLITTILLSAAFAQTGSIVGSVTDASTGEFLVTASVEVVGEKIGTSSDIDGKYVMADIPVGAYNVRFSMVGYKTIIKNRVVVKPGKAITLNAQLDPEAAAGQEVVVTPTYFEETKDALVSSKTMDFEEIITQPGGAWDVQRAVQVLPAVVSNADNMNEIVVRGGNYGENIFVLDNIEVANPNHFAWQGTGGGAITAINTDFVESIDFIAGAFPAKYGDAASSVMIVNFREGARDKLHFKGDIGMAGVAGTIEAPIGNGSFMLNANKSFLDLVAGSFGMTAIPYYWGAQSKVVYDITPKQKLSVLGLYADDWIKMEGDENAVWTEEIIDVKMKQYALGMNYRTVFGNGFWNATISRTMNDWVIDIFDTSDAPTVNNYSNEYANGAKFDISIFPYEKDELSAGVFASNAGCDYYIWERTETLFIYVPGTDSIMDMTDYIYSTLSDMEESSLKLGGYAQYKHHFGNNFSTIAGMRYDYFDYTKFSSISPRIGLTYHASSKMDINLAYGRQYQTPQWLGLTQDTLNKSIRSKYTDQVVLGIDHLFAEDTKGIVETYYKLYRDVPVSLSMMTADPNDWSSVYVNAGKGYAYGAEFFLQKKVKNNLWGIVSYSYSVAKAQDPRNPDVEFSWDFDYGHVVNLVAGYRKEYNKLAWYNDTKKKWWYRAFSFVPLVPADESEYSIAWRYTGGKPYTPMTYHPEWRKWTLDGNQPINSARQRPYDSFALHLQQRWFFNKFSMLIYWEITNLFNTPNVWDYQYNSDGTKTIVYQRARMIVGGIVAEF